jgi:putative membrane protein
METIDRVRTRGGRSASPRALLAVVGAMAALGAAAWAQPPAPPASPMAKANRVVTAQAYVAMAGASDQFEIQSSQIALQRSKTSDVRAFAQMMVDHHTATTKDLMAAAAAAGMTPPPPALPKDKAAKLTALRAMGQTAFDAAYLRDQVAGHQEALALHTGYAADGDRPALKAAAQKTAPIVRSHLERAQALAAKTR